MKKIPLILATALLAISCEQQKIAFVDNTKLISEYQEKIDLENEYQVAFEQFQKQADSLGAIFQAEAQDFQNRAQKMSQSKAQEEYSVLMQKRDQMGQRLQQQEQILNQNSSQEVDSLVKKIRTFVKDYGKRNGYTFILSESEGGSVFYGEDTKDITADLLRELNEAYKNK